MDTFFIWLGSGRAKRHQVGNQGQWLDKAAQAGLPVPNGAVLLDSFFQLAQQEGVIFLENGRIHTPNPTQLHHLLYQVTHFPKLDNPATIHPLLPLSPPTPILPISLPLTQPNHLAAALKNAWETAITAPPPHNLLILERVEPQIHGTAQTSPAEKTDKVETADSTLTLPHLTPWQLFASPNLPPFAQRLQKLLRGIRRTFAGSWWVQWIDDGRICWLVQLSMIQSGPPTPLR